MNINQGTSNIVDVANQFDSDKALIESVKAGDKLAYRRLYDTYVSKIYPLCFRLTANKELAEEAVQEVFIQIWKNIDNYRGDSKFSTWLYSVASNITISHIRKQKTWWQKIVDMDDESVPDIPDSNADKNASKSENNLDILIRRLPEKARIVFVLYAVQGYRHEDISHITGMAVGSSKAQLHRAKKLLKEWMINA